MRILRVIATVDPATGGPVSGMQAITPPLAELGHETEFLTVDRPDANFLQSWVGAVHALGPAVNSYCYSRKLRPWLDEHIQHYDAVIVHGLWQYLGVAVRAASLRAGGPPYFVFPHGMLDPTLRSAYPLKHVKKWLYWQLAERRILRDAQAVFFTCEEERRLARTTFPRYTCNERVVSYGAALPDGDKATWAEAWQKRRPSLEDRSYWLYLGRLHSKKGVDTLLRAYGQRIRQAGTLPTPDLVIAGPCLDQEYLAFLQNLAMEQGVQHRVHWIGMLTGDAKWGALSRADAFVLPSLQENFGIAVVEALACGTPVLVSDRVNIWRELQADGAALVDTSDDAGTIRLLERWQALSPQERTAMRTAALASFQKRFEIEHAAEMFSELLADLLPARNAPTP